MEKTVTQITEMPGRSSGGRPVYRDYTRIALRVRSTRINLIARSNPHSHVHTHAPAVTHTRYPNRIGGIELKDNWCHAALALWQRSERNPERTVGTVSLFYGDFRISICFRENLRFGEFKF